MRIHRPLTRSALLLALFSIGPLTAFDRASAQTTRESFWVADGFVRAVARSGSTLYVGGDFTTIGPPLGAAVSFDAATAQPLLVPRVVGEVHAVAADGSGGWFLAGLFDRILGTPRASQAIWNPLAERDRPPGIYFVRYEAEGRSASKQVIVLR